MVLALMGLRDYAEAEDHLNEALLIAREMKSRIMEFTCLLFEARLLFEKAKQGSGKGEENKRGIEVLRMALELGKEQGYMNLVVWYPSAMSDLCITALEEGIETAYVQQFIRQRNLVPDTPPVEIETWPWPVKIRTLGGFELYVDDKRVTFSGKAQKKPIELLKALLSQGGRGVSEEQLTEVLWPDSEGDAAHSAFTTTLSRLRQLLGNEKAVRIEDGKASLDQRSCWTDLWAFEEMVLKVERMLRNTSAFSGQGKKDKKKQQTSTVIELMERTIALYRGSYLPSDASRPWTVSMRERLRNRFLKIVSAAGDLFEQSAQWERAISCYQRAMETDNLSEELFQRLMTCQLKLGKYDEAITTYRQCKHTLMTVFGLTPSETTESLHQSALRRHK
jgi:DNA-binding SARP family transcriptional activator